MNFHNELNPKIWNKQEDGYTLKPEVAEKLNEIADAFIEYMEINTDAVKDIVITGSSASYNYTPHSDLDLHLKVDYDLIHEDCPIVEGFLWALKSTFNKDHDISIYGIPVEVYAEPLEENAVSNGIYSLRQGKWLKVPESIEPTDNDAAVIAKYNELKEACERIKDSEVAQELLDKIYEMRKAGLSDVGEFSTENLAFKKLRDDGIIDKLKEMKKEQIDKELSLESVSLDLTKMNNKLNEALDVVSEYGTLGNRTPEQHEALNYAEELFQMFKGKCEELGFTVTQTRIKDGTARVGTATAIKDTNTNYNHKIVYIPDQTRITYTVTKNGNKETEINFPVVVDDQDIDKVFRILNREVDSRE